MNRFKPHGFALPLVLVVLSIVALAVASVGYAIQASSAEAGRIVGEIRGAAACNSIVNIAAATVQTRLRQNVASTVDELVEAVCAEAGNCVPNAFARKVPGALAPEGVVLEDFYIGYLEEGRPIGIRPVPTGGFANLRAEERLLSVYVQGRDIRSGRECRAEENLTIASMSPLQFDLFVDPAGSFGASQPVTFSRLHHNGALELSNVSVATDGQLTSSGDARVASEVVPPLMQSPNNDEATAMRFIVDPAVEGDRPEVMGARLAHLADIRIVDGVWYLRDDTLAWPGRVIWSDHPGENVEHKSAAKTIVQSAAKIGQADIFPVASALTPRPSHYSYYETDSTGAMNESNGGVISYGAMIPTIHGPVPALWPSFLPSSGAPTDICNRSGPAAGAFTAASSCGNVEQALVDGTRSGFEHDGVDILPINFDVEAFAAALHSFGAGELGTYFPTAAMSSTPRQFNGIVWITQTWRGGATGLKIASDLPQTMSTQGTRNAGAPPGPIPQCNAIGDGLDSSVSFAVAGCPAGGSPPPGSIPRAQASVPMMICGGDTPASVAAGAFQISPCASTAQWGADGGDGATPNAVRIVRAALIDGVIFPLGLTIATNLPMYVQGDVNTRQHTLASRKVLLAADRMTMLSAQFRDDERPWGTNRPLKLAGSSTVVASFLTGVPKNSNFNQAFRAAEDWRQSFALIKGSLVFGYYSVFDKNVGHVVGIGTGLKVQRDEHLLDLLTQPPGTPRVLAGVTQRWRR